MCMRTELLLISTSWTHRQKNNENTLVLIIVGGTKFRCILHTNFCIFSKELMYKTTPRERASSPTVSLKLERFSCVNVRFDVSVISN